MPVPESSRLFESSLITKSGYLEAPLNLQERVVVCALVDTYGLDAYGRFRKWRTVPPGLFSDIEFLNKCNRSVTWVVGHKLAQWLDPDVQIPEYWGVSGVGGRAPTNWKSTSMPPVVFDLPDGCHEWNLEAIYRFYATSPLFGVLARHSPISANQSKCTSMPPICIAPEQLRWATSRSPAWLVELLSSVFKLNGSALGREFAALDSARQSVVRDQSLTLLPILMQSCHRHDLYDMSNDEFHDGSSASKLLSGALILVAYHISGVYKTTGLSGKNKAAPLSNQG